ncbi:PhoH family protein [Brochothrix campestris]|uniref:PhoH-like protein n=1 Tax=Brochothrix campestris FSL F6-1037 TaxID=1265861 RepID=W7CPR4_9LIST|nr:PhoH family protein [Brochothrix campestris]EUJ41649.1 PhoH family protein [Brochothrix campestris FSL F6-1037]
MTNASNQLTDTFTLSSLEDVQLLIGTNDANIQYLEEAFGVVIITRGESFTVTGTAENIVAVKQILVSLNEILQRQIAIDLRDVTQAVKMAKTGKLANYSRLYDEHIFKTSKGNPIRPKTFGQKNYIQTVKAKAITFGIGPAGTGKTYLAVVMAVEALKSGKVSKILLTRPAVEAGESLGFLPGDLKEKVDPYLRPVYDALHEVLGRDTTTRLLERGVIEIAPLAYMRGRTIEQAFIILDEAQNTTTAQMKMFLTRLGYGSKMIINGDVTQIDLPKGSKSGLIHAEKLLQPIKDLGFVTFKTEDVVRHPLVGKIIDAYGAE